MHCSIQLINQHGAINRYKGKSLNINIRWTRCMVKKGIRFVVSNIHCSCWLSHACNWNTTAFYDYLLSLLLWPILCRTWEYILARTAISSSFYASYKQLSSCCSTYRAWARVLLIDRTPPEWCIFLQIQCICDTNNIYSTPWRQL